MEEEKTGVVCSTCRERVLPPHFIHDCRDMSANDLSVWVGLNKNKNVSVKISHPKIKGILRFDNSVNGINPDRVARETFKWVTKAIAKNGGA